MKKELPFVGRESQLEALKDLTHKATSSLVVVCGRRRVGKSRLIEEFSKKTRFLQFAGLTPTPETTAQDQRDHFAKKLTEQTKLPFVKTEDWADLFSLLSRETKKGRVIILLDEISWMGSKDHLFLGKLKDAWDTQFKKNPQLILILCGSVSSWVEENILRSTGFMGRVSLSISLKELRLSECNELLDEVGFRGSDRDRFKILSVTGGIPRYIEEIKPNLTAEMNLQKLCFRPDGILFAEFKDIFSDLFSTKSKTYKQIVSCLVTGSKPINDIAEEINLSVTGYLSECLDDLVALGFVRREHPWSIRQRRNSRLSHFRLSDNYVRFYLKYIEPNAVQIEESQIAFSSVMENSNWESIMGLQFENLVLMSRELVWKQLSLSPGEITHHNPFFQRKTTRKKGCQIDYLIQTRHDALFVCEIKFSKHPVGMGVVEEVKEKISRLAPPRGFSVWPVLIHVNGVSSEVKNSRFFSHIIDFSSLLHEKV